MRKLIKDSRPSNLQPKISTLLLMCRLFNIATLSKPWPAFEEITSV
jgi:hypothetical protein